MELTLTNQERVKEDQEVGEQERVRDEKEVGEPPAKQARGERGLAIYDTSRCFPVGRLDEEGQQSDLPAPSPLF